MSMTVHFGKLDRLDHHCIHEDGSVTLRAENANGGTVYIQTTPSMSEALRDAFNGAQSEVQRPKVADLIAEGV